MFAILRRMAVTNWVIASITAGYSALVYVTLSALHIPFDGTPLTNLIVLTVCMLVLLAFEFLVHAPFIGARRAAKPRPLSRVLKRATLALPSIVCMACLLTAFGDAKQAIPKIEPFYLDPLLWRFDRMLFLGHDPWRLLQPVLGYPLVTFALSQAYEIWLVVFYLMIVHSTLTTNNNNRNRFTISFAVCWILMGTFAAIALSSAGPCFFDDFYNFDPYADLNRYLRSADERYPIISLGVQRLLLASYRVGSKGVGMGISAAPSIHVATATLIACYGWARGSLARYASLAFLGIIALGSIALGFHYAVDGVMGAAGALAIWWAVGRALAPRRQAAVRRLEPAIAG